MVNMKLDLKESWPGSVWNADNNQIQLHKLPCWVRGLCRSAYSHTLIISSPNILHAQRWKQKSKMKMQSSTDMTMMCLWLCCACPCKKQRRTKLHSYIALNFPIWQLKKKQNQKLMYSKASKSQKVCLWKRGETKVWCLCEIPWCLSTSCHSHHPLFNPPWAMSKISQSIRGTFTYTYHHSIAFKDEIFLVVHIMSSDTHIPPKKEFCASTIWVHM